ncbi:MAG: hypothetical protein D6785_13490 [Planctomycetota bacterium]|nr:MAG: hypothetical protein D6785_13490 [Planctomycetota bacterium]
MGNKVVARFLDGRVEKGKVFYFDPQKKYFPLKDVKNPYGEGKFIHFKDLKAVFFVKDLVGNKYYHSNIDEKVLEQEKKMGQKGIIHFKDGETLFALIYEPDQYEIGFFAFPVDPKDNNERVFVLRHAVDHIEFLSSNDSGL